ncbi:MAG: hypothetical protein ACTTJ1_00340 [Treponema sp.]
MAEKLFAAQFQISGDDGLVDETLDKLFAPGNLEDSLLHSNRGVLYTAKKL